MVIAETAIDIVSQAVVASPDAEVGVELVGLVAAAFC
jgi:hypothetical protein